ncbi:MAG: hypothetical protein P4L85_17710 [Paludisphaera borealis]|uniref:hypothetical protein n=1 Tax=Paludisphaera borealis TaxID=1387353 RepID=UPI00284E9A0E|nr:hypothetical protein [Paludisphaera borealis]MDR3621192.1 hypothetical protein [Paludisphaera borealis]
MGIVAALATASPSPSQGQKADAADPDGVVVRDDFERETPDGWDFTDKAAWRIVREKDRDNRVLELFQASKYEPPVRSPFNMALRREADLGGFTLDVKARSTTRDYGHRDLCLIFGYVDPSHFYYVHIAKEADPHANSIFLVDGKPRVSIAEDRTKGTAWTDGWHDVRLKRDPGSGLIEVYFDDMKKPVMTAHDKTFPHGRIGLGSFDDTGMFDDLVVKRAEGR